MAGVGNQQLENSPPWRKKSHSNEVRLFAASRSIRTGGPDVPDLGVRSPPPRPAEPLHIIVVEDEALYRDMLIIALGRQPSLEIVGSFAGADAALARCAELRPDAALLDISLGPGMNGIQLGLLMRDKLPDLGIVLLSNILKPSALRIIPDRELRGWSYLHKKAVGNVEALHRALANAVAGQLVLDPAIAARRARSDQAASALSPRQMEVLRLIAHGLSNAAIAARLDVAEKTVENYITLLYEKLDISDDGADVQPRVKAALHYLRELASDE